MTDDAPDEAELALDARLHASVHRLAQEAPAPPPFPAHDALSGRNGARGVRPRALVAAGALVAIAITAGALVVRSTGDGPSDHVRASDPEQAETAAGPEGDRPDRPFFGTHWVMVSAVVDGAPVRFVSGRKRPTATFDEWWTCPAMPSGQHCAGPDGPRYSFFDGCNHGGGTMAVEGRIVTPLGMGGTAMGCTGPGIVAPAFLLERTPGSTGSATFAPMSYEISGERLVLSAGPGQRLTYRATDDPFGPPDGAVVVQDTTATGDYRLVWEGPDGHTRLGFEGKVRRTPELRAAVAIDPLDAQKVHAATAALGWEDVVFGLVPGEAASAVYRNGAGLEVPLTVTPIPDDPTGRRSVHAVVPSGDASWTVSAYDADGGLIETFASAGT